MTAAVLGLTLAAGGARAGCGDAPDPCAISDGTYHAVLPDGPPRGAVVFLHGWGSSGAGTLRMTGLVEDMTMRGYAFLAPDGVPRQGRDGRTWGFHPDRPGPRDEAAFLVGVADDAAARFGIPRDRIVLAGFSIGGSMTAYVACGHPASFAAYAPVGGSFWRPHPAACAGPVRLLHTHGWADGTVPLEGRAVGGTTARTPGAFVQGDVFETLELWRVGNGCSKHHPDSTDRGDGFWRRVWSDCAAGSALQFALHPGGHAVPRGWADLTLDWFEEAMGES